jgi:hypothetical protein
LALLRHQTQEENIINSSALKETMPKLQQKCVHAMMFNHDTLSVGHSNA